jgi:regulator of nucleoside diphosphate kinase
MAPAASFPGLVCAPGTPMRHRASKGVVVQGSDDRCAHSTGTLNQRRARVSNKIHDNSLSDPCVKVNVADFANLSLLGIPAALQHKLERAVLVPTDDVPPDVVTMLSRVVVADVATGRRREIAVVYPAEADAAASRVSVLDELGMALLAASIGDTIEYESIDGPNRSRVEEILYQPEYWMRMHLVVRE